MTPSVSFERLMYVQFKLCVHWGCYFILRKDLYDFYELENLQYNFIH